MCFIECWLELSLQKSAPWSHLYIFAGLKLKLRSMGSHEAGNMPWQVMPYLIGNIGKLDIGSNVFAGTL